MISYEHTPLLTSTPSLICTLVVATLLLFSSFNDDEPWSTSLAIFTFAILLVNGLIHFRSNFYQNKTIEKKINSWILNFQENNQNLKCTRIKSGGSTEEIHFADMAKGDIVICDERLSFILDHISNRDFLQNNMIRITEPVIHFLRRSLDEKRLKSTTFKEISAFLEKMDIFCVPIVLISAIIALIIAYLFAEPEETYANERFDIRVLVLVIFPLLLLTLPLFTLIQYFCDNVAVQYMIRDEKSIISLFSLFTSRGILTDCVCGSDVERLSDITGVCAVDKKGILATPFPLLEKLFFITSSEVGEVVHISSSIEEKTVTSFSFDHIDWHRHIHSISPLVESIRLNGCTDGEGNSNCLCAIRQLIPSHLKNGADESNENTKTLKIRRKLNGNGLESEASVRAQGRERRDGEMSRVHWRGSPSLILPQCNTYWDGNQVKQISDKVIGLAYDFASRHLITSECVALSCGSKFNQIETSTCECEWKEGEERKRINRIRSSASEFNLPYEKSDIEGIPHTFLALAASQEQALPFVFEMIESLQSSCIRFILFSKENQLRSRIIGEKLGLEAGWNCHISLKSSLFRRTPPKNSEETLKSGGASFVGERRRRSCPEWTSLRSHTSSLPTIPPNIARLPTGIDEIRPHLEAVDNVPLLVSLFTDSTVETTREMIEILHEYKESELILGSVHCNDNVVTLMKGVFSIGVHPLSLSSCAVQSPLYVDNGVASIAADLIINQSEIHNIPRILSFSRRRNSLFKQSLLFYCTSSVSLSLQYLFSVLLHLPFPISSLNTIVISVVIQPLLALSISSHNDDSNRVSLPSSPTINSYYTSHFFFYHFPHFITLLSTHSLMLVIFGHFTCPLPFLCQWIQPHTSLTTNKNVESLISILRIISLILSSIPYIFPYEISLRRLPIFSTFWTLIVLFSISLQIYSTHIDFLTLLSPSIIVFYIVLSSISVVIAQSYKRSNVRIFKKENMRRKFGFDTKLGMNSPY